MATPNIPARHKIVWTMSTVRKVSRKSAFPTSFDLSTVFKGVLWIKQVYKMIKVWRQVFFVMWYDRNVLFPNCNQKWIITNKKCSWQKFKHYLVLGLTLQELPFQVFWIQKFSRCFIRIAYTYMHIYVYICTYMHTYLHTYTYIYIYLFIYRSIYLSVYIYI